MLHDLMAATTAWVLLAVLATLGLVLAAAGARAHGRRLEQRMVAELGRRWDPPASEPDPELRITLENLLSQRDGLLEEFHSIQSEIDVVKRYIGRRPGTMVVEGLENVIQLREVFPPEWAERRR